MTEDRFVFVPHVCPNNRTYQFRFDSESGSTHGPMIPLSLHRPMTKRVHVNICFRPEGDVAYIVNEQGNTVTAHRYDPEKGTLEIFQNISTLPPDYTEGGATAHVEVHSKWKVGVCIQSGARQHCRFLTSLLMDRSVHSDIFLFQQVRGHSILTRRGAYLYGAGEAADTMTCYRVDAATGELQPLQDYAVGSQPFWVMVTSLG